MKWRRPDRWVGLLLALVVACGSSNAALRIDVEAYLQRAATWSPVEAEAARSLERILATEFVDEAAVRHEIDDAIPRVEKHLARVRQYRPATKSVQDVHDRYQRSWEALLDGFAALRKGFDTADWSQLAKGRHAMAEWRDGLRRVAVELRELADRSGAEVVPTTPS